MVGKTLVMTFLPYDIFVYITYIVPAREMGPRELLKSSSPSFGTGG